MMSREESKQSTPGVGGSECADILASLGLRNGEASLPAPTNPDAVPTDKIDTPLDTFERLDTFGRVKKTTGVSPRWL